MTVTLPEYDEPRATEIDWSKRYVTHSFTARVVNYITSIFPIIGWIRRYNLVWLYSDLVAGITVGAVLVPQSMSYAQIATLPPQYGLYSSFVGVFIYCFFATSKDVSIGPVAVMSLQVSKVIASVVKKNPEFKGQEPFIAVTLSLLCGAVALGLGVLRLGFILEFIPLPAIMGFMTGSAINIMWGQVPSLMGYSSLFNTRENTYLLIIDSLKHLPDTTLDAAFGLVSLFILYFARWIFGFLGRRYPKYERLFFFINVWRNGLVVIFATIISYVVCRHSPKTKYPIKILKTVPSGLQHVGAQKWDKSLMSAMASELPISVVILLLEHISISKSFGRVNNYKINPNQEVIAIGVTNLIGTFFTAYPATGSFSRTALKNKCGVKTPLAGIFTGVVVLLALYALTGAFYWIPNAGLAAVIIHAVSDLIQDPRVTYQFWKASPIEAYIFLGSVLFTVFLTIESGVYFAVGVSIVLLLLRVAFPRGQFLGRIRYIEAVNPVIVTDNMDLNTPPVGAEEQNGDTIVETDPRVVPANQPSRTKWVPQNFRGVNPAVRIESPPEGVFVYRFGDSLLFPNASRLADELIDTIKLKTRPSVTPGLKLTRGQRAWNDDSPLDGQEEFDERPLLRAVVFDMSASPYLDLTAVQNLVDVRKTLNRHAGREVEYHFAGILSNWTRRALIAEGFGIDPRNSDAIYVDAAARAFYEEDIHQVVSTSDSSVRKPLFKDEEQGDISSDLVPVLSTHTPYFHLDIPDLDN